MSLEPDSTTEIESKFSKVCSNKGKNLKELFIGKKTFNKDILKCLPKLEKLSVLDEENRIVMIYTKPDNRSFKWHLIGGFRP